MALQPGTRPMQFLPPRRALSWAIIAASVTVHIVALALVARIMQQPLPTWFRAPPMEVTQQYAMHFVVLPPVARTPSRNPERRPVSRPVPAASITTPEQLPPNSANTAVADERAVPRSAAALAMELPAESIVRIGPGVANSGSDTAAGPNLLARLGFRVPGAGGPVGGLDPRPGLAQGDPKSRGGARVAELLAAEGTACPSLRRPPAWRARELTVAVAFVVDQNGVVDPSTLRVIQSPEQPQTDYRYYSHIYAVSATAPVDGKLRDLTASYDSVITQEVVSHVAALLFRPALRDGQAIRSTVMVSCQSP